MRILPLMLLAAGATLVASTPADAREGCGRGFHCTARGFCVANRAGVYYRNHGWWDGRRYWRNRYRHNNGWRYR